MKKKLLVFCVLAISIMCLFAISASAASTETIDGVTYYLNNGSASVTNANKNCTLETVIIPETVTGADGNEYTVKIINQQAFYGNKVIKYVSLPATITTIDSQAFRECTSLQLVDFNDNPNNVGFGQYANGHFRGCTSLKAVALPDNITTLYNGLFTDCAELEVVYLPASLEKINGNKYGDGAFDDCKKVYLTNEKFDVEDFATNGLFDETKFNQNKPEKKDVYFFPSNLTTMGNTQNSPTFLFCAKINPVLVFPTTFTGFLSGDGDLLNIGTQDSPKKVVFLGDVSGFNANTAYSRQNYVSYYFMNSNDKVPTDTGYKNGNGTTATEGYMYFCADNGYYQIKGNSTYSEKLIGTTHISNPNLTEATEATCVTNRGETTYCFCGTKIDTAEVEGTALGHEHNVEKGATKVAIEYANYLANGALTVKCARCDNEKDVDVSPIISSFKGISTKLNGDGLTFGYTINYEALDEYVAVNGEAVELGFVVAVQANVTDDAPLNLDGTIANEKVVKASIVKWSNVEDENEGITKYTGADFVLRGNWDGEATVNGEKVAIKDVVFCMAGYIIDGDTVAYINANASGDKADTAYYNQYVEVTTPEVAE